MITIDEQIAYAKEKNDQWEMYASMGELNPRSQRGLEMSRAILATLRRVRDQEVAQKEYEKKKKQL